MALLLLEHVELLLQALLLVLEHPLLELVDLLLLVLIDIVELGFLEIELADFVHQTQTRKLLLEGICGHHRDLSVSQLLLLLLGTAFGTALQLLDLFFFQLDLLESGLQLKNRLSFLPHIDHFGSIPNITNPTQLNRLLIQPHTLLATQLVLQLSQILD